MKQTRTHSLIESVTNIAVGVLRRWFTRLSFRPRADATPDPAGPVRGSPTKRVYLSGPMSGIQENNFPAFRQWAAHLRSEGYDVVSPAEIQEANTWELCLRADLREMCTCDAIALMPGWEGSKGANLELHVAHRLGMRVIHLPLQFDLVMHLHRQRAFSLKTFGPGQRVDGVCDHIKKELREVHDSNGSLAEWVDVIILGFDGAWRSGSTPAQIVAAIVEKQTKNESRTWPDWRTAAPGKAIEHDRSMDLVEAA